MRSPTSWRRWSARPSSSASFRRLFPGSKAILDRAVRLIDQLARDGENQGADLRPAATNYYRAGLINFNLNQLSEAARCFERTADLAARLPAVERAEPETCILRAAALRDWGVTRIAQGNADDAARHGPEHWRLSGRSLARRSSHVGHLCVFTMRLETWPCSVMTRAGAQLSFREALVVAMRLVEDAPADSRFVKAWADVYSNQGMSLQMEALPDGRRLVAPDKLAAATASHRQVARIPADVARLEPGKPEHLADVAASLNHLGNASLAAGESGFANAESLYREARTILEGARDRISWCPKQSPRRRDGVLQPQLPAYSSEPSRGNHGPGRAAVDLFSALSPITPRRRDSYTELGVALEQLATNLQRRGKSVDAAACVYDAAVAFARAYNLTDEANRRGASPRRPSHFSTLWRTKVTSRLPRSPAALRDEPAFGHLRSVPGFPHGKAKA